MIKYVHKLLRTFDCTYNPTYEKHVLKMTEKYNSYTMEMLKHEKFALETTIQHYDPTAYNTFFAYASSSVSASLSVVSIIFTGLFAILVQSTNLAVLSPDYQSLIDSEKAEYLKSTAYSLMDIVLKPKNSFWDLLWYILIILGVFLIISISLKYISYCFKTIYCTNLNVVNKLIDTRSRWQEVD